MIRDTQKIIPRVRSEVLAGVHIVFSGVIPLDVPQETTDLWKLGHMFGAKCHTDLTSEVTHVVTAKVSVEAEARRELTTDWCSVEPKKLKQQESGVGSRLCVLSGSMTV